MYIIVRENGATLALNLPFYMRYDWFISMFNTLIISYGSRLLKNFISINILHVVGNGTRRAGVVSLLARAPHLKSDFA